jgi:lysophospholipase L1-like esterase
MALSLPIGPPLPPRRMRRIAFRILAVSLGTLVGLALLEVLLRYFPPVQLRIRGSRIALPLNQRTVFKNTTISKVDAEITQTRNSIGFRGADPPPDFARTLSVVTVGGSTTECYYLSDTLTWPEQLRQRLDPQFNDLWLNNAGLDGHTTFGHQRLFDQYLVTLRPRCILFLIGANDVGLDRSRDVDDRLRRNHGATELVSSAYYWTVEHTATAALLDNMRRTAQARAAGVHHQDINHSQLKWNESRAVDITPEATTALLSQHRDQYLAGYRSRIETLIQQCREIEAVPILLTQPTLFGPARDPETGVDLARMAVGQLNGDVQWQILELYNSTTREVAREQDVPLVDLAQQLPKDSRYYYDYYHFTNAGAAQVAVLVERELTPILARAFPDHVRRSQPSE